LPGSSASSNQPSSAGLSPEQIQIIQHNTLAVLTDVPEKLDEWRQTITNALTQAQAANLQHDVEFLAAILALLGDTVPIVSPDNPHGDVIRSLAGQLGRSDPTHTERRDSPLPSELPADFISRCVAGLSGSLEQKEALFEYLREVNRKTSSAEVSMLIQSIQLVLVGKTSSSIHPDLPEPFAAVWRQIMDGLH
jgi:hypothetical protein